MFVLGNASGTLPSHGKDPLGLNRYWAPALESAGYFLVKFLVCMNINDKNQKINKMKNK